MIAIDEKSSNQKKLSQISLAWRELLSEVLRRGFHGIVALEVHIQDGSIQWIRRRVERVEK